MNNRIARKTCRILLTTFALVLTACGGSGGDRSTGRLQVALTDAAPPDLSEVVLTIREVRAVPAGHENDPDGGLPLIASFSPPLRVNVLEPRFRYQQQVLGEAVVPAGDYNQIRLVLEENADSGPFSNYIVLAGAEIPVENPLKTPSAHTSGLKITGHFSVGEGEAAAVALDFDPSRAIVEAGSKYNFKPNGIRVVRMAEVLPAYGALAGTVLGEGGSPLAGAVVYALPKGGGAAIAATEVNSEDGSFRLFLPSGDYLLQVRAAGFLPYDSAPEVFTVSAEAETDFDAGSIALTAQ